MHDDLERLIERSLGERAERLDATVGSLDDVVGRAERRQQRRRATAVVGSLAVFAIGMVGLSVAQGADEPMGRADAPVDAPIGAPDATAPASIFDGHQDAYRCEQRLDITAPANDDGAYYAVCVHVQLFDGALVESVPTTVSQAAATWPACEPVASSEVAVITAPCGTVPHSTIGYCEETDASGVRVTVPCQAPATTAPCVVPLTESCGAASDDPDAVATTTNVWAVSETEQQYVVETGDNLTSIADRYQIDVEILVNYNMWPDGLDHLLLPGDVVMIPPGTIVPNS